MIEFATLNKFIFIFKKKIYQQPVEILFDSFPLIKYMLVGTSYDL